MPRTGRPRAYSDLVLVSFRMESDLVEQLDRVSDRLGISRSANLRAMVEYCVSAYRQGDIAFSSFIDEEP